MSIADELEELIENGYIRFCVIDVRRIEDKIRLVETEIKRLTEIKDEYCKVWLDESEKVKELEVHLHTARELFSELSDEDFWMGSGHNEKCDAWTKRQQEWLKDAPVSGGWKDLSVPELLRQLPREKLHELISACVLIADPLSQELIRKASEVEE